MCGGLIVRGAASHCLRTLQVANGIGQLRSEQRGTDGNAYTLMAFLTEASIPDHAPFVGEVLRWDSFLAIHGSQMADYLLEKRTARGWLAP